MQTYLMCIPPRAIHTSSPKIQVFESPPNIRITVENLPTIKYQHYLRRSVYINIYRARYT